MSGALLRFARRGGGGGGGVVRQQTGGKQWSNTQRTFVTTTTAKSTKSSFVLSSSSRTKRGVYAVSVRHYNPMFPQRAVPELDAKTEQGVDATDFLSLHGGKVALAGFGLAIALFWTWYKGGVNRNDLEEKITNEAVIEPYEIQEMRLSNTLSPGDFQTIAANVYATFPSNVSYKEFIKCVNQTPLKPPPVAAPDTGKVRTATPPSSRQQQQQQPAPRVTIHAGHLMDRVVANYVQCIQDNAPKDLCSGLPMSMTGTGSMADSDSPFSSGSGQQAASLDSCSFTEVPIPRDFLLTVLNFAVCANHVERLDLLFDVALLESAAATGGSSGGGGNGGMSTDAAAVSNTQFMDPYNSGGNSSSSSNSDSKSDDSDADEYLNEQYDAERVSVKDTSHVIDLLTTTNQLPAEKVVAETGVKWPVKTYRVKRAEEMIEGYFTINKIKDQPTEFSRDEFKSLFLSRSVCVWAECYRKQT
jgi:hypothetical protein